VTAVSPDHPYMVSVPVSPYCELARWTLDRLGVAYVEDCHAPVFHLWAARRHGGGAVVPVLDTGQASLSDARQVVEYYDQRAPEALRLYPANHEKKAEAKQLFDELFDQLGVAVRAWAYAYMLPRRESTARVWIYRVPALERRLVPMAYPLVAALVRRDLGLRTDSIPEQRAIIDASLGRLEARLADGRRYLLGDHLTAPDLALAALIAPAVLPPEYGGPLAALDELPKMMRREVEDIRASPAGQLSVRLYREERPHRTS
jgi:glutathione S-transferase